MKERCGAPLLGLAKSIYYDLRTHKLIITLCKPKNGTCCCINSGLNIKATFDKLNHLNYKALVGYRAYDVLHRCIF